MNSYSNTMILAASIAAITLLGVSCGTSQPTWEHREGKVQANGITIAYQIDGPPNGEPLVFINGFGGGMGEESNPMTEALAGRGFLVVRFDSRDAGSSTHMTEAGAPDINAIIAALTAGEKPPVAYSLVDLAADVAELIEALGFEKAHIVGLSEGGMIGQILVADYPERVITFTSISTTSGNPETPYGPYMEQTAETMLAISSPDMPLEEKVDRLVEMSRKLDGDYAQDEEVLRQKIREALEKEQEHPGDPNAAARQGAVVLAVFDRRPWLMNITVPTLIIHGTEDPLAPLEHGQEQEALIPASRLEVMEGMRHGVPDVLWPQVADLIAEHTARTQQAK